MIAGVTPFQFTLRELVWMRTALQMEEWDRIAWLCLHIPRFTGETRTLEDFNPLRKKKRVSMGAILSNMKQVAEQAKLPKTLTEEEIESRWQEYLRVNSKCE